MYMYCYSKQVITKTNYNIPKSVATRGLSPKERFLKRTPLISTLGCEYKLCFNNCNCCTIHNSDIDECASNLCDNGGTCDDLVNGYRCQCADGYTGEQCKIGEYGSMVLIDNSVPNKVFITVLNIHDI